MCFEQKALFLTLLRILWNCFSTNTCVNGFHCTHCTISHSTLQYNTVQYSTVQYSTMKYSTVQYSTVQYSTVQYSTVQYSTVQYSTVHYGNGFVQEWKKATVPRNLVYDTYIIRNLYIYILANYGYGQIVLQKVNNIQKLLVTTTL